MSRKGIQAVLLSSWLQPSLDNFIDVANQYTGKSLDIGFAPFFHTANPFGNAAILTQKIKGKRLKLIIHLSFHQNDQMSQAAIISRAKTTAGFVDKHLGMVDISVCPRLEDNWGVDEYSSALKAAALELNWDKIKDSPNFTFRRSNNTNPSFGKTLNLTGPSKKTLTIGHGGIKVETEIHGPIGQASKAGSYSNDGNFVWFDNKYGVDLPYSEDAGSATNATPGDDAKYSLSSFNPTADTVLLWRNAYNLYGRKVTNPQTKLIEYFRSALPASAKDSKSADPVKGCAFNPFEQEVFREFLGIIPAPKPKPKTPSR